MLFLNQPVLTPKQKRRSYTHLLRPDDVKTNAVRILYPVADLPFRIAV